MKKRVMAVLLATFMLVYTFSACGSKSDDVAPSSTQSTAAPTTTAAATDEVKPVTLTLWIDSHSDNADAMEQKKRFTDKYPYITFDNVNHEGDAGNDYITAVAAGTGPDITYMSNVMSPKVMRNGLALPLDEYVKSWDEWQYFDKKVVDTYSYNGTVYGIPESNGPMVFAYNKKLFAEAGITEPPKTWDDVIKYGKLLTKPEKQQSGYGMLASQWTEWFFQYYVWQAGGDLTKMNDDGTATLTFTDPAVIKAATFYQDLKKAGVTQKDLNIKFQDMLKAFAAGKIAMMDFAIGWVSNVVSNGMKPEDVGICANPAGPSGVPGVTSVGGGMFCINPKISKEKQDAAFKWLSFCASKDEQIIELKLAEAKNAIDPANIVRTDINITDYVKYNEEQLQVLKICAQNGKPEFYGKADFGKYVDRAVQTIISNPNADPMKEFQAAQDAATKEALDNFNKTQTAK